jgi:Kef-type K+ transport system membrane component KefB
LGRFSLHGWLVALLALKLATKLIGVYPVARRYARRNAVYTTLLMSTGLTFGTISSLYGLNTGIITRAQFSVLITVVILSAVLPTLVAQSFFSPQQPRVLGGLEGDVHARPAELPAAPGLVDAVGTAAIKQPSAVHSDRLP